MVDAGGDRELPGVRGDPSGLLLGARGELGEGGVALLGLLLGERLEVLAGGVLTGASRWVSRLTARSRPAEQRGSSDAAAPSAAGRPASRTCDRRGRRPGAGDAPSGRGRPRGWRGGSGDWERAVRGLSGGADRGQRSRRGALPARRRDATGVVEVGAGGASPDGALVCSMARHVGMILTSGGKQPPTITKTATSMSVSVKASA